jgi:hypothetical protein
MFTIRNTDCHDKQDIGRADEGDNDKLIKLVLGVKIFAIFVVCPVTPVYRRALFENTSGHFENISITN